MKVHVNSVKGYSFEADLDVEARTEILKALGLPLSYPHVLQIEGRLSVDWDDDIANPYADEAYILHPTDPNVSLKYEDYGDLEDFTDQLDAVADYEDRGAWSADREGSLIDAASDSMGDR
jgi:hypothetical protein